MLRKLNQIPLYVLAIALLLFTGVPFFIMVCASFKSQIEFMGSPWALPENFSLENYRLLFESDFFHYFL